MSDNPAKAMGTAMTDAAARGAEAAKEWGRKAMEAGQASMAEFSKLFSDMKVPTMPDMEALMAAHRRNMEALSAANRVALEGAQAVAKRHMEIMQQTMQELSESMRDLAKPENAGARVAKQTELMKHAYERAVAHIKELSDLIQRANGEALATLNSRFTEAMDEVKALQEKASRT